MQKAVFFDRDGIVNKRLIGDYVKNINEFEFNEDFFDLFLYFKKLGYIAVLVTNQQGIGKGLMDENALAEVHSYMQKGLKSRTGFEFDDIYYSPYLKAQNSPCRKPNPGMFISAIEKFNINASDSFTIGDSISDVIAGKRAGTTTFLIGDFDVNKVPEADYVFANLKLVLNYLIETKNK